MIGDGGMATVFLARDLRHKRDVAVKVLREDLSTLIGPERFTREIEVAARLQHPHVLPVYDSGETGGLLYYVMPLVEANRCATGCCRSPSPPARPHFTRKVAGAPDYARRQRSCTVT